MNILAVDTATEACSAALMWQGSVSERYEEAPRRHGELLLPMIDSLLQAGAARLADLDGIAFGAGPGSFTGVRIAAAVVQGLALGAGLPVVAVSSLAALAQAASEASGCSQVAAVLDARMGEVYFGLYRRASDGRVEAVGEDRVCRPEQVPVLALEDGCSAGSGWRRYAAALGARLAVADDPLALPCYPRAGAVARLALREFAAGRTLAPQQALPNYVRHKVTHQRR